MAVRVLVNMAVSFGVSLRERCLSFGYWSPRPGESVHCSVIFFAFNARDLLFMGRSSGKIGAEGPG
jgi:hypothetical protein